MSRLRMAQYGTKHGHAAGKLRAMMANDDVECIGVFEPDTARREALSESSPWRDVRWLDDASEDLGSEEL